MPSKQSKAPPKATEEKPKKTSKTSKAATTTPEPVPVKQEAVKQEAVKQEAVKQEAVEVVENVVEDDVGKAFADLLQKLQMLTATFTAVKQDFKALEKRYMRELRAATKATDKKKKSANSKPRQPSGFVKPTKIRTELAHFLGKPQGTEWLELK